MKKCWVWLPLLLMLWGCGQQAVFEHLGDVYQVMASQPSTVIFDIPSAAAVMAMGSDRENAIYFCDGYTVTVQTVAGGDLSKTIADLTGFLPGQLTMFQLPDDALKRYTLTWTCVGEGGDQVGRMVLLDDGSFHYAVTVMCSAENAGQYGDSWDKLLRSVKLENTGT